MSFFRNETDLRYARLFSMLKMIDVLAKLEIIDQDVRMPAVLLIMDAKKFLDESTLLSLRMPDELASAKRSLEENDY